jgi:putative chitinase
MDAAAHQPVIIKESVLIRLFPRAYAGVIPAFAAQRAQLEAAGILETFETAAMFLAQAGHESTGLSVLSENLSYSAERLTVVWPNRFPTLAAAQPYARNPEALANKVYGGRMGNDTAGDGWLYRGRGVLQLTGEEAYREVGKLTGLPLLADPGLAQTPGGAVATAAGFWRWKGVNRAPRGDVRAATEIVNGGVNGLAERATLYRLALELLRHV